MSEPHACQFSTPGAAGSEPWDEFAFVAELGGLVGRPQQLTEARLALLRGSNGRPAPLDETEIMWAGRFAWRNHSRCIGRLHWRSLAVRDRRGIETAEDVIDELIAHLVQATQGGQIRPTMTVFAPASDGRAVRIWNHQVCGYAGYRARDGTIRGDPLNLEMTERAEALGWQPPLRRTPFDLLPLVVTGRDGRTAWRRIPEAAVLQVRLRHPEYSWFEGLGLRWYAVPLVCDLRLRAAGTDYTAAPFNGWYMGTEIGARDLADSNRYNLLPMLAARLGLDLGSDGTLWRDRALVELNRAVLHSFAADGIRMVDHHTAAAEFVQFCEREKAAGRPVSARWDWIVPPLSPAATPVFHRPMSEFPQTPNFHRQPAAWQLKAGCIP